MYFNTLQDMGFDHWIDDGFGQSFDGSPFGDGSYDGPIVAPSPSPSPSVSEDFVGSDEVSSGV